MGADILLKLRYNLFTFGFGTRKCLGSHLGELMTKAFMLELIRTYRLKVPSDGEGDIDATSKEAWVPISAQEVVFERI